MPPSAPRAIPKKSLLSLAIAGLLLGPAAAQAATVTVTTGGDSGGAGNCTLRQAIASINGGGNVDGCAATGTYGTDDTIVFASAVTGTITLGGTQLSITKSLSIEGPGADKLAVDGDGKSRVISITRPTEGPDVTVSIDGLTIQNGSPSENGGGIAVANASLALSNCTVSGNSAVNSTAKDNSKIYGGGLYAKASTVTLTNSTVSGNSVDIGGKYSRSYGGGLSAEGSTVTLTNSTVSDNSANGYFASGGGLSVVDSSMTLTNSTVSGNNASGRAGAPSSLPLHYGHGGGLFASESSVTLTNSTVSGNSAGQYGGGLGATFSSSMTLTNSTVSSNSSGQFGGGLSVKFSSSVTLTNSTVSGNSASDRGGGLYAYSTISPKTSVTLTNTLLADNLATVGTDCFTWDNPPLLTGSYNLIGDAASACGLTNKTNGNIVGVPDPLIGALADNGCVTKAGNPNGPSELYGCVETHALLVDSPALDVATSTGAPPTDQRGVTRPQESGYDIGAFELEADKGACGTAAGETFTSLPDANLCTAGMAGSLIPGNTEYTWSCAGRSTTASCTATRHYAIATALTGSGGQISPTSLDVAYNATGTFTLAPDAGYAVASVTGCNGSLSGLTYTTGAITSACTVIVTFTQLALNGACGTANGKTVTTEPDQNLCTAGEASSVTEPQTGLWSWSCLGSGGGTTQMCSAGTSGGIGAPQIELTNAAGCTLDSVILTPPPDGGPEGQVMPYGVVDFELSECTGTTVTVKLTFTDSVAGHTLWKYGRYPNANSATIGWYAMPGATVNGNIITYSITDNAIGDSDPEVGAIADPAGPGYPLAPPPTPIPTLSVWGLLGSAGLLGLFGAWRQRRQARRSLH